MDKKIFDVIFWGTRGSSSFGEPNMMKYGCNTPCISVECGDSVFLFDAGTGIISFNKYFNENYANAKESTKEIHIFLSHYHADHLEGLPFFDLAYNKDITLHFYGKTVDGQTCSQILDRAFSPPFFPVHFISAVGSGHFTFQALEDYKTYYFGDSTVETIPVNHPGGANSFKVTYKGITFCYVCDYEYDGDTDEKVLKFIEKADLVAFDACYTNEDFKQGWGHSTWHHAINLAKKANVAKLALCHHSPSRTDAEIDKIQDTINETTNNVFFAKDRLAMNMLLL